MSVIHKQFGRAFLAFLATVRSGSASKVRMFALAGRRVGLVAAAMAIMAITSGCASITGTTIQSMSVQTRSQDGKDVTNSACELMNNKGKWFVTSPGSVTVARSNDDMQVLCNKQGLEPGRASVVSATKGSMFGNILLGGGIGAIVDHNNGAAYEYPAVIQVVMGTFTKIEAPETTGEQQPNEQPNAQPTAAQKNTALPVQAIDPTVTESASQEKNSGN